MKRLFAMLLAAVMVCTLFAGCAGDGTGSGVIEGGRPK